MKVKSDLRYSLDKLGSKIYSFKSLKFLYRNWLKIVKVYYLGGSTKVTLNDPQGYEISFVVDKINVSRAIMLARALNACKKFKIDKRHNIVVFDTPFDIQSLLKSSLLCERMFSLCLLANFDARRINDRYTFVEVDGVKFIIRTNNPWDIIEGALLPYHHETHEYRYFQALVRKNSLFIDVGAYIGGYSVRACKIGAKVIAIEPDKENFEILVRNLKLNNCNAYALNVAAGSKREVAPMYSPFDDATDRCNLRKGKFIKSYVEILPIDEMLYMLKEDYSKIDLVKIDVEGFEYEVLLGMRDSLKKVQYLMIEVTPETMRSCFSILNKNFRPVYMVKHSGEDIIWYNIFFRRK